MDLEFCISLGLYWNMFCCSTVDLIVFALQESDGAPASAFGVVVSLTVASSVSSCFASWLQCMRSGKYDHVGVTEFEEDVIEYGETAK